MENSRLRGSGAILILFALSGMAALIYEIVWYQLLQLAIGSTAMSLGVLLASFMGGLCLGSSACRAAAEDPRPSPCAFMPGSSLASALCGLLVLWLLPLLDKVYFAAVAAGMPSHAAARAAGGALPVAAHHPDGRVAARDCRASAGRAGRRLGAGSMPPTRWARWRARCWPRLCCCACSTSRWRVMRRWRSIWWWRREAGGLRGMRRWRNPRRSRPRPPARSSALAGLCRHRAVGPDRAGRRSGVDAPVGHDVRRHGLCLCHHPGGVPGRHGDRQFRVRADPEARARRAWRWASANCCWRLPSPGRPGA